MKSGFNQLEVDRPPSSYSYDELVEIWNGAKKNGRLYKCGRTKRALLGGVIAFLKGGGRIVSATINEG